MSLFRVPTGFEIFTVLVSGVILSHSTHSTSSVIFGRTRSLVPVEFVSVDKRLFAHRAFDPLESVVVELAHCLYFSRLFSNVSVSSFRLALVHV